MSMDATPAPVSVPVLAEADDIPGLLRSAFAKARGDTPSTPIPEPSDSDRPAVVALRAAIAEKQAMVDAHQAAAATAIDTLATIQGALDVLATEIDDIQAALGREAQVTP